MSKRHIIDLNEYPNKINLTSDLIPQVIHFFSRSKVSLFPPPIWKIGYMQMPSLGIPINLVSLSEVTMSYSIRREQQIRSHTAFHSSRRSAALWRRCKYLCTLRSESRCVYGFARWTLPVAAPHEDFNLFASDKMDLRIFYNKYKALQLVAVGARLRSRR